MSTQKQDGGKLRKIPDVHLSDYTYVDICACIPSRYAHTQRKKPAELRHDRSAFAHRCEWQLGLLCPDSLIRLPLRFLFTETCQSGKYPACSHQIAPFLLSFSLGSTLMGPHLLADGPPGWHLLWQLAIQRTPVQGSV